MPGIYSLHIRSPERLPSSHKFYRLPQKYASHERSSTDSSDATQVSLLSEVTLTSDSHRRRTEDSSLSKLQFAPPSRRRRRIRSSRDAAPDPDVVVMYLRTSSRSKNIRTHRESGSFSSMRDDYSSYRRRPSTCATSSAVSSLASSSDVSSCWIGSCDHGGRRSSVEASDAEIGFGEGWGYFVDCMEETHVAPRLKEPPSRRRRIFDAHCITNP
mmetsp:Transcript_20934/g.47525  ORF Transcript_20934/g.47525 Transcript_20934/m.47525 type:complete len:214 (-) Transcript_20934:71-712(-)